MKILEAVYQIELINIHSLKEKRSIVKKLINDLRKKYNISISESGFNDNKRIFEITIITLSQDKNFLLNFFEKLEEEIEYKYGLRVIFSDFRII
ncbi:hypothetical protein SAMN02745164_01315 [Marinitoga hydrogenitolerans DSM 16785]|uniref:DUF503 domain-containing protein n=1 Tax=Marinitoga hydrogenitolerans (strain DSM 16785 / JCM 12826 / AT1271) TaxID=1122195 RepID=A0A1M4X1F7_MARH1|nr:DUF503 domain-containing protein [Marinitoga hydrogenitolerans]SHE87217.1 hypothetical protein SAMN02745164_01315 [Marinitoga hydrogenitolerans DSM 16785]